MILFDKLQLPKTRRIKTGYTTDANSLAQIAGAHPIIEELLGYREVAPFGANPYAGHWFAKRLPSRT